MDVSMLTNLLPLHAAQPVSGAASQNAGGGEEGAFQLLLENMLFEVVAGQVFKEGGGLLAGMDLGLFTEEGQEGKEHQGQDLLALLEMLQGPLLDHFREVQLQISLFNGEPFPQGQEIQAPLLPVFPEMEGKPLTAGMQQANEQLPAGQGDNLIHASMADVQFQGHNHEEAKPQIDNMVAKSTTMENQIKLEVQSTNGTASQLGSGLHEEQQASEINGGRENNFMNLMGDQNHRTMETAHQVNSVQQPPRAGGGIGYSELAEQIIQSGKLKLLADKQEMEIQLKPEYLGKLAIRLSLENGVMTARFLIENHQVARMVDNNLPQLKQTLEDQGIRFEQVQVEVGDPGSFFQERHQEWHRQSNHPMAPLTSSSEEGKEEIPDCQEFSRQGGIDYRA